MDWVSAPPPLQLMLALLTRQRDMLKTERFFNMLREYVAGARRALKTWRTTRWRQPGFCRHRTDIATNQIGFWGQSQSGWIAPLAASRVSEAAFAIALSGGGPSPAEEELFDSEYE